jgi:hypothetical protein
MLPYINVNTICMYVCGLLGPQEEENMSILSEADIVFPRKTLQHVVSLYKLSEEILGFN